MGQAIYTDGVDAYMGKHRLHVGYGVEAAWGDGSTYANAPQWLKNLYDTRSSEYVETGSMSVTDESLKANRSDVVPNDIPEPTVVEDEVVENNFTQLNPSERARVRSSTSSSRPSNISSRDSIPQSFETNALDALSSDSQLGFLSSSNDRQRALIDQINDMIYDDDGNYVGDSLSRDEGQTVMNLIDRLEKEDDLYKSLIADEMELPSSYIKNELDRSEELLSVLDDVIDQIEKVETEERAVE